MDAGSVIATLGGRFDPHGFNAFGSAMYRARSEMEAGEKRMVSSQARVSKSLHNMGQAAKIGAVGGIAGLGVVIGYSIKKAADFEQQLDALGTASNASGRQMGLLKKQAMDAGAATKYSALEAAQAQTELAKGGLSASRILGGALQGALALAAAGELDLADAASYTVNALKLFKLGGDQATHVADALSTAANTTTADVQDFGMALVQGGGAAKSAGYSFDQTVTILEALAEVGVKNSDAGTSMKAALLQLVGPTKKQAGAAKEAGLSFLDQHGSMKSITAISAMLRRETGDMTKAQRTALFQTLAGTDGFRTLLALYDAGPEKLAKLEQANKRQGVAAQVSAEKQDNLKGKWENFTGSVETAAIVIGDKFLPLLTRGTTQATDFLNHLSATGQLDSFANGLVTGTREAITVVGELAHVVGDVAHAAAPVVGVLGAIGHALDLGDPGHIEAILAAIIGFKVAGVIAPMVVSLAEGIALLSTAPTVGALGADLIAMVNPVTAAMVGVGLLAGALVLLGSRESAEEQAARANAAAHRAQAEAIKSVRDAERASADKGLAAQQSTIDLDRARDALHAAAKGEGGKKSEAYKTALIAERQAVLRAKDAHDSYSQSIEHQNASNQKSIDLARKHINETKGQVKSAGDEAFVAGRTGNANDQAAAARKVAAAQGEQAAAVEKYIQAVAHANVSDQSRQRLMHGASQITEENVQGISHLIDAMDGLPTKKQTRFLLTGDQSALASLGTLAAQLTAMGRRRTVAKVLANADSASAAVLAFKAILAGVPPSKVARVLAETKGTSEIEALKNLIDSTNGKTVALDVTTRYRQIGVPAPGSQGGGATRRAAGRGPIGAERAIVGEGNAHEWYVDPATGKVMRIDGPRVMDIPPTAYIIPAENQYRGRALGLLSDVAKDLGVAGYAKGKKPHFRPSKKAAEKSVTDLPVPPKVTYAAQPEDELKGDVDAARTAWKKRDKSIGQYEDKVRKDREAVKKAKNNKKAKAAAEAKLRKDEEHLSALKRGGAQGIKNSAQDLYTHWREQSSLLKKLQAANREIERLDKLQENDRQKMANAAGAHDEKAYDAAQADRQGILGKLKDTYEKAIKYAKGGSKLQADLEGSLQSVISDIQDSGQSYADAAQAETEADRIAETGMTDAERARLSKINKDISLAALTADIGDDTTAAGEKQTFLQGILGLLTSGQRQVGDDVITDVADQLKQAQDNVKSLTGAGGTNDNPDVQAQLDQANEQKRIALDEARINRQALEVFAGAGDIGTGGANALRAAQGGPNITIQTLHPGDPATLRAIGDAATGGMSLQPFRSSSVERLGL